MQNNRFGFLSGNALKIIAAVSMFIDHLGFIFFPNNDALRIIGRLAFPIFSFFIAVGCKYTKNKLRYFLQLAILGGLFQAVACFFTSDLNIFITFSLSVLMILPLQNFKYLILKREKPTKIILSFGLFVVAVSATYVFCHFFPVDYGFAGCLVPVAASLFMLPKGFENRKIAVLDNIFLQVWATGIGLLYVYYCLGWIQNYLLLSLPLLLFYSGERGKLNLKYFFYIFYPAHLVFLYGLFEIIYNLG